MKLWVLGIGGLVLAVAFVLAGGGRLMRQASEELYLSSRGGE